MKVKKYLFTPFIVAFFTFAFTGATFGSFWETFEQKVSLWNPIGKALDPIEEAVPGLYLRGFLKNRTYYNTTGRTHHEGIKGIPREWDFANIFWEGEFEWRYKFNPTVEIVNIYNFQYDAVPDWVISLPANGNYYTRHYRKFEEDILKELYVTFSYPHCYLKIGKQQVVWGKMEGPLGGQWNKVNPGNFKELGYNHEWDRIPTWMGNFNFYWSDYALQFLWIPDFEARRDPYPGTVYFPPTSSLSLPPFVTVRGPKEPDTNKFKNHEFGCKFDLVKKGWDVSLMYLWAWSDKPTRFRKSVTRNPMRPRPPGWPPFLYEYEDKHTRLHHMGWAIDKNFGFLGREWVFRNETVYNANEYVTDSRDTMSTVGDEVVQRDNIETAISFEASWLKGELLTSIQPSLQHYFGHHSTDQLWPGKKCPENWWITVFVLRKTWYDDRLTTQWTGYWWMHDGAFQYKAKVGWEFSSYLTAEINYYERMGNHDDIVGRYDNWDIAGFELTYSF